MEFGLSFLPDVDDRQMSAVTYFRSVLALSEFADENGFSHIKMTEHYLEAYGGYCPSPLGFLSAVAARTKRIRLMTGCLLPVFHHPIQIASEAAMVDAISAGRLDLGVARAYMPYEFEAFGISMDESRARFDETVQAVIGCWTNTDFSMQGEFTSLSGVTTLPRPVQHPHPPVWVAAVRTPSSFVEAGRRGFGLLITPTLSPLPQVADMVELYRSSYVPSHDGDVPRVLASLPLYVGESPAEATRTADHYLDAYLTSWMASADAWNGKGSKDYPGYENMGRNMKLLTAKHMRTVGGAVIGDPEHVLHRVRQIQSVIAADGYLWQVDFGGIPLELSLAGLQRFVDEVRPGLLAPATSASAA